MQNEERNIPSLVRRCVNKKAINLVPELYKDYLERIDTKKGEWKIFRRNNFVLPYFLEEKRSPPSNDFCSVYEKDGEPKTLFSGKFENRENIIKTIEEISKNVLEQRKWFALPPRELIEGKGHDYGISKGLNTAIIISTLGLIDIGLSAYSKSSGNIDYQSSLVSLIEKDELTGVIAMMGGFIGLMGQDALQGAIFSRLDKVADRRRIKNLPEGAISYLYGKEAENQILEENSIIENEKRKARLYDTLKRNNVDISKEYFYELYSVMQDINERKVIQLRDYLDENQKEQGVPLEKIVKAFSQK